MIFGSVPRKDVDTGRDFHILFEYCTITLIGKE